MRFDLQPIKEDTAVTKEYLLFMTNSSTRQPYPPFRTVLLIVLAAILCNAALKYWGGLGKSTAAEKEITEFADDNGLQLSDYPNEIVNMLKINEETKDFVLRYPLEIVNFKPDIIDFSEYKACTAPPQLMQWDTRWGYMTYDKSIMGLSGSAPTALSMAALYVTHDMTLTPVHTAELAIGTSAEHKPEKLLADGARALGMTVTEIPKNDSRLRQAVSEEGTAVVCLTDGKALSQAIVIRGLDEDHNYLINDTLFNKRSAQAYTFKDIGSHIKKVWQYSASPNAE